MKPLPRLGLYGGTFDPVHEGHIQFAKQATEWLKLDTLFWVPAAKNPLKVRGPGASPNERVEMLEQAFREAAVPEWKLYRGEIQRPPPSFTIDTVLELQSAHPKGEWYLLLGSEVFQSLAQWKHPERLKKLVRFAVTVRPGERPPAANDGSCHIDTLPVETLNVSSTSLRRQIRELFDSPRDPLPKSLPGLQPGVWEYIKKNRVYAV